jgi:hypothetical protein
MVIDMLECGHDFSSFSLASANSLYVMTPAFAMYHHNELKKKMTIPTNKTTTTTSNSTKVNGEVKKTAYRSNQLSAWRRLPSISPKLTTVNMSVINNSIIIGTRDQAREDLQSLYFERRHATNRSNSKEDKKANSDNDTSNGTSSVAALATSLQATSAFLKSRVGGMVNGIWYDNEWKTAPFTCISAGPVRLHDGGLVSVGAVWISSSIPLLSSLLTSPLPPPQAERRPGVPVREYEEAPKSVATPSASSSSSSSLVPSNGRLQLEAKQRIFIIGGSSKIVWVSTQAPIPTSVGTTGSNSTKSADGVNDETSSASSNFDSMRASGPQYQLEWRRLADLNEARFSAVAVEWQSSIYVIGGVLTGRQWLIERYDHNTNKWHMMSRSGRSGYHKFSCVSVPEGILRIGNSPLCSLCCIARAHSLICNGWMDGVDRWTGRSANFR